MSIIRGASSHSTPGRNRNTTQTTCISYSWLFLALNGTSYGSSALWPFLMLSSFFSIIPQLPHAAVYHDTAQALLLLLPPPTIAYHHQVSIHHLPHQKQEQPGTTWMDEAIPRSRIVQYLISQQKSRPERGTGTGDRVALCSIIPTKTSLSASPTPYSHYFRSTLLTVLLTPCMLQLFSDSKHRCRQYMRGAVTNRFFPTGDHHDRSPLLETKRGSDPAERDRSIIIISVVAPFAYPCSQSTSSRNMNA